MNTYPVLKNLLILGTAALIVSCSGKRNGDETDTEILGVLDTSWGTNGSLVLPTTDDTTHHELHDLLDYQGGLFLSGRSRYLAVALDRATLWRTTSDGSLDTTFASTGVTRLMTGGSHEGVGSIVVGDYLYTLLNLFGGGVGLTRHNVSNGALDTSYGTSGIVTFDDVCGTSSSEEAIQLRAGPSGTLLALGDATAASTRRCVFILKIVPDTGSLAAAFGNGDAGSAYVVPASVDAHATSFVTSSTGDLWALVNWGARSALLKFNSAGDYDTTLGTSGVVFIDDAVIGADAYADASGIAIDNEDRIYLAADSSINLAIVRMLSNGTADSAFADNGKFRFGTVNSKKPGTQASLYLDQSKGFLYLGFTMWSGNSVGLTRLDLQTGEVDLSFGTEGLIEIDNPITSSSTEMNSFHTLSASETLGKLYFGWAAQTGGSDSRRGVVTRLD